jgi:hypothetical protein
MVGTRLEDCAKWLARGLRIAPMAGARLVSGQWQQMASARESNNQTAIGGLRRPTEKIAARQLTDCAGQKKNLRRGNRGIAPGKRKVAAWQSMDCAGHKKKIAARQSMDCAGQKKKLQCSNWGIAPASSKIVARQSGYRACLFKICGAAIRVSRLPF